jgi:Chaperone of endosialidase
MGRVTYALIVVSVCCAVSRAAIAAPQSTTPTTAVPRLVRVTGSFRPADGRPPAPIEQITFAVYADGTGGTPLWQETQNVAIEANGQYSVLLGATGTEGLPVEIFASGDGHWLAVRVERPGESDQPRVRLASVPYALRASDADTLGGKPATAYVLAPPSDAAGKPVAPSSSSSDVVLGGTPNLLAKYVNTTDIGTSAVYELGGSVGIGTVTPVDALHVTFTNTNGGMTGLAVQNLGSSSTSYSGMLFYDQNGQLGQFQGFNNVTHEYRINNIAIGGTIKFMTNSIPRFVVATNGNVGIGTPTPAFPLEVVGDVNLMTNGVLRQNGLTWAHKRGFQNVALGYQALANAAPSAENVAIGDNALAALSAGSGANVAVGRFSLNTSTGGAENTAIGYGALQNGQGRSNVALGAFAGLAKSSGDFNLYVGYNVANDINAESNTIRVGDSVGTYNRFFVGAVRGVTTGAANAIGVLIDGNGQLGTINSSRRYKEDIRDMGNASSGLMKLRPVTYRYTQPYADGSKPIDYGLIAEEVEEVYPDLVAHSADGQVETVQYHKINAMLLNEVQKQHRQLEAQRTEIELLKTRLAALESQKR